MGAAGRHPRAPRLTPATAHFYRETDRIVLSCQPVQPERPRWSDSLDPLQRLPKVSLHDHLDGSLRPETLIELADRQRIPLPHRDPDMLGGWFQGRVAEPAVAHWDEMFGLTTAVMQDPKSLARVAAEFVLDLAADGVVYGETRWAPEKHTATGLSLDAAVDAVREGLVTGQQRAAEAGHTIIVRQILSAMRASSRSNEIAKLTLRHYGPSVVGFDLAGEELGNPATEHLQAINLLHDAGIPITLHAGEHAGLDSLRPTVFTCHPVRIGHGVRVVEDMHIDGTALDVRTARVTAERSGIDSIHLGALARWIRDRQIPLEVCLTSNSQGNVVDGRHNHPIDLLNNLGFTVTINPDNRLMSATCVTREMRFLVDEFGWTPADLHRATVAAIDASFLPLPDRAQLRDRVIDPGWALA